MRRPLALLTAGLVATLLLATAATPDRCVGPYLGGPQVPTVAITSPAAGSSHSTLSAIRVEATASDPDGTVARVIFYRDGVQVFEDTTAPYAFDLTGTSAGNHLLQANAYDNAGNAGVSAQVPITVVAPPITAGPGRAGPRRDRGRRRDGLHAPASRVRADARRTPLPAHGR